MHRASRRRRPQFPRARRMHPTRAVRARTGPCRICVAPLDMALHRKREGDILVFLPGRREIEQARVRAGGSTANIDVVPLHGESVSRPNNMRRWHRSRRRTNDASCSRRTSPNPASRCRASASVIDLGLRRASRGSILIPDSRVLKPSPFLKHRPISAPAARGVLQSRRRLSSVAAKSSGSKRVAPAGSRASGIVGVSHSIIGDMGFARSCAGSMRRRAVRIGQCARSARACSARSTPKDTHHADLGRAMLTRLGSRASTRRRRAARAAEARRDLACDLDRADRSTQSAARRKHARADDFRLRTLGRALRSVSPRRIRCARRVSDGDGSAHALAAIDQAAPSIGGDATRKKMPPSPSCNRRRRDRRRRRHRQSAQCTRFPIASHGKREADQDMRRYRLSNGRGAHHPSRAHDLYGESRWLVDRGSAITKKAIV